MLIPATACALSKGDYALSDNINGGVNNVAIFVPKDN